MTRLLEDELVVVEDNGWPIFVLRLPAVLSERAVRSLIAAVEGAYSRGERFTVIVDTTAMTKFPAAPTREVLGAWIRDPRRVERETALKVGTAVVVTSGPLRALVAALNLMRRRTVPEHWASTFAEAVDWSRRRLLEAAVPMTSGSERLYEVTRGRPPVGVRGAR